MEIPFASWIAWLFTLVISVFLFPLVVLVLYVFLAAVFVRAYGYCYQLQDVVNNNEWDAARNIYATALNIWSWLWNGYEIVGLENIPEPKEGGALLVLYHPAIPVDYYYMLTKFYRIKRRCIRFVVHRFLFKIPGLTLMWDVFCAFTGSFKDCVQYLKEGHLVALGPGGLLEGQFGGEEYHVIWGKRIGFAKVALEAQVPIIPVFTKNMREALPTVKIGNEWLRKVYEKTGIPVVPMYGGFPVKLRTYVGEPIPYDPNMTAEELAAKTAQAMKNLIRLHQRVPANIVKALIDRIYEAPKQKSV